MTAATRTQLAEQALEKSLEVREEYGYDFRSPLCVYELADRAGVKVQFVDDVSMEGVYAALTRPTVLLSSLRPLARRAFTCAHELGHHVFGHGSTIDELRDNVESGTFSPIEFLADTFAGFILMPAQGVKRAFSTRGLAATTATPEQVYAVASSFGVGYETIIGHLEYSLRYINAPRANLLLRRPQFSWTRIKGESDVKGGGGHGWVEASAGSWVGADGGSPEGDRSQRRRRGGWVGGLGARPAVERKPETGRGVAAAARRWA